MPLTKTQKMKLGGLLAEHRAVVEIADYLESPTMRAVFKYVNELLKKAMMKERKVHLPERRLGRDCDRYVKFISG